MAGQYEIPMYGGTGANLHGWLLEAVAEGDIWLRAQKPTQEWPSIDSVLGPLFGGGDGAAVVGQSNTGYNLVRHIFHENRATLSNFKHAGEFSPRDDDAVELSQRATMLTVLDRNWERQTFYGSKIRDCTGNALARGTGYLYEDWDSSMWGPGRGDIRCRSFEPNEITFVQLPKTHDIQGAYVVLIREELPLMMAKRMYAYNPTFANALRADSESPGWIQKGMQRVQQFISPALRAGGSIRKANDSFPTTYIWTAYTLDSSINETSAPMKMGAKDTNWSYTVPFLGQPIPQAIRNPATGDFWTLPATPNDCLLFPLRRMTVFSRTGTAYDGSSPWWHGCVPLARVRFNDLPWEALGASQVGDATTMQTGIIQLMRDIEDSASARLNPPMLYDDARVDKAWAEAMNPRKAGVRASADLSMGSPVEFPVPPEFYNVPQWITQFISEQEGRMEKVTAARDLVAVAKAQQIPSADTLEKLLEMAGPIVQDMTSAYIQPLTELGEWRKALYFQFYTRSRMLRIADTDAMELLLNVQYEPDKLPAHLQPIKRQLESGKKDVDVKYQPERLRGSILGEHPDSEAQRIRSYIDDFRYDVTQSGVSELNRMSQVLLMVQLKKIGMPLSWYTLAKTARIPNYGPPPKGTDNEQERAIAEKRIDMELQVELAQELQASGAVPPTGGGEPGGQGPGRPQSFNRPPHIEQKDGGTRSTVATS